MTHAVDTMAWTGETPWHGLGFQVGPDLTPLQMLKAAKINWTVSKRSLAFSKVDGKPSIVPREYALVRDDTEVPLSIVGENWNAIQNVDAVDFFRKWCAAGHMKMETMGALWGGRYIWALARINADFAVGKSDKVQTYVCLMSPHVHGKAMIIQFTTVRVVCWNTLSFALGADLKGKGNGNVFRMPHTQKFDDSAKKSAEIALGLAQEQAVVFKEAAALLARKKAKPEAVEEFFCEVVQYKPKAAKKGEAVEREPRMLPQFRAALTHAPGATLPTAQGTWWGAVNAVTAVADHISGRERDTALKNAWLGNKANIKRRALDLALQKAK